MQTSYIATNRTLGLDVKVWIVMLVVAVICGGLVSYIAITDEPCVPFRISTRGLNTNKTSGNYHVGEPIRFAVSVINSRNITWDFNDKSGEENGTTVVSHSFAKEGEYHITAKINGKCEQTTTVYIQKQEVAHTNPVLTGSNIMITGTDVTEVDKTETFFSNAPATSYEWTVLNRNEYEAQNGKIATFIFKTQGRYIIKLKLDNNREKTYFKHVYVSPSSRVNNLPLPTTRIIPPLTRPMMPAPRPEPQDPVIRYRDTAAPSAQRDNPPVERTYLETSNRDLKTRLGRIIDGSKENFDDVLNTATTNVLINNKRIMAFEDFCNAIKNRKKVKIGSVEAVRDERKNVIRLNIECKRKNVLGAWVDF
jgi:hypothetical protein